MLAVYTSVMAIATRVSVQMFVAVDKSQVNKCVFLRITLVGPPPLRAARISLYVRLTSNASAWWTRRD